MTAQPVSYEVLLPAPPRAEPEAAPAGGREVPARQCTRCGAVGTHYLTCPGLRLPSGYRVSSDAARRCGGPDHPDWPRPPQR